MADNTTLNTGAGGDSIRDLARSTGASSGSKTQVVTLDLGGANTNAEVLVTAGVYDPTKAMPGAPIGRTSKVSVTPTISTSAYTAGYEVGALMTFASVFDSQNSGVLQSIRVRCKSVQTTNLKLYLFTANPTNTTWSDHAAPAINAADIPALVGPFVLYSPDSGLGTETTWVLDGIGAAIVSGSSSVYGILVATGTPTFGSTSDVSVELTILKD